MTTTTSTPKSERAAIRICIQRRAWSQHPCRRNARGIIDTDGDATIVIGDGDTLRFESDRLPVEGCVAAPLQRNETSSRVVFTEGAIAAGTVGVEIANQDPIGTRFAALAEIEG